MKKKIRNKILNTLLSVLLKLLVAGGVFFVVTFVIYFFNLDMKLTSMIEPILLNHYDKIPRNQRI